MKKYYIDHPDNDKYEIEIPFDVYHSIIKDHTIKTFYWAVGIGCTIIGFLLGIIAS